MGRLADLCAEPQRFQCLLILPEPRPGTPWGPFKVTKAHIPPASRTGTLTYSRKPKDGWKYGGALLSRGDCLLHIPTGAIASVLASEGSSRVLVEGWDPPPEEAGRKLWREAPGLGEWVVWGTAFRTYEEIPENARPGEVIPPERMAEARSDLFRHPERLPWAQAGFHVGVDPKKLNRKQRKQLRGYLRRLLGGIHTVNTVEDVDALIEKTAQQSKKSKAGGEWVSWRLV
jgi:hypothetical protein